MTREELHRLVWSEPATRAARRLSVSDTYLRRVCRTLAVPSPPRGYWAKRAAGLDPPVVPLPAAPPGTPPGWFRAARRPAARQAFRSRASEADVATLVDRAARHFGAAAADDGGAYLRPRCRALLDLTATPPALSRCLGFARALFAALSARGHRVRIAPPFEVFVRAEVDRRETAAAPEYPAGHRAWSPLRPTVAYVAQVAVGLAIVETCEYVVMHYVGRGRFVREAEYARLAPAERAGHTWKRKMHVPTGRLRLVAYSPVHGLDWRQEWTEAPQAPLEDRLAGIVDDIEAAAAGLAHRLGGPRS